MLHEVLHLCFVDLTHNFNHNRISKVHFPIHDPERAINILPTWCAILGDHSTVLNIEIVLYDRVYISIASTPANVGTEFLFICSTTSTTSNLNNSNLRSVQNEKKKQNRRPQPRNPHFFSELCDFLKLFGLKFFPQRVPPSIFLMFCNTMDVKKSQRVPPFTFFGTVTLFKNLIKTFSEIFSCLQRVPPSFFKNFLQPAGVSQSPKGPPSKF